MEESRNKSFEQVATRIVGCSFSSSFCEDHYRWVGKCKSCYRI